MPGFNLISRDKLEKSTHTQILTYFIQKFFNVFSFATYYQGRRNRGARGVDEFEARTVPSKNLAGLSELVGPGDKK